MSYSDEKIDPFENDALAIMNSYEQEVITFKSEIPFTFNGIAIPKVDEEFLDNIKLSFNYNKSK